LRKIILSILAVIFIFKGVISQEIKTEYFIGTYDKKDRNKTGICADRGMEKQAVLYFKEYETLRIAFREKYKTQNPGTTFIAANRAAIIYSFEKRRAGWNCTVTLIGIQEGKNIANAQELLVKKIKQFPNDYATQPSTLFTKEANSITPISVNTNTVFCNNLPTILISEQGVYYWKLADGCYKIISKLQYEATKKLPTESERKRHIQNCTGNPIDTIKLKAKPYQD
jgi:hypothetical protein